MPLSDSGNSVTIKDWNGSNLGLTLKTATEPTPDTEKVFTVSGNNNHNALSLVSAEETDPNYNDVGYLTINASGGNGHDLIMGLNTDKDTLIGGDGNDVREHYLLAA